MAVRAFMDWLLTYANLMDLAEFEDFFFFFLHVAFGVLTTTRFIGAVGLPKLAFL